MATKADRYEGIDGLKAYAIIGIASDARIIANGKYGIGGFAFEPANTIFHKPRFPFYDGQRFWYVLRLLPENY